MRTTRRNKRRNGNWAGNGGWLRRNVFLLSPRALRREADAEDEHLQSALRDAYGLDDPNEAAAIEAAREAWLRKRMSSLPGWLAETVITSRRRARKSLRAAFAFVLAAGRRWGGWR